VVTFLALILMSLAQPALLYIVPCTLLPTYLIAWRRGEFLHLWSGQEVCYDTCVSVVTCSLGPRQQLTYSVHSGCVKVKMHATSVMLCFANSAGISHTYAFYF